MLRGFFLVAGVFLCGAAPVRDFGKIDSGAVEVSMVALLAGDVRDRSLVRTMGVVRLGFEENALCLSKEALTYQLHSNCLALQLNEKALKIPASDLQQLSGMYVLVEGTFDRSYRGHLSMNPAGIRDLTRLLVWEDFVRRETE